MRIQTKTQKGHNAPISGLHSVCNDMNISWNSASSHLGCQFPCLGWGLLRQFPPFHSFPRFFSVIKTLLLNHYNIHPPKARGCQFDNFVVTGGNVSCHNDNLQCHQWWQSCQIDNPVFSVSLTSFVTAKPKRHPSNMNVIQWIQQLFFSKSELLSLTNQSLPSSL